MFQSMILITNDFVEKTLRIINVINAFMIYTLFWNLAPLPLLHV